MKQDEITVLIAGSNGVLGSSLVKILLSKNFKVYALVKTKNSLNFKNKNLKEFTYSNFEEALCMNFDVFINCIGKYSFKNIDNISSEDIQEMYNSNVIFPIQLLLKVFKKFKKLNSGEIININSIASLEPKVGNEILYSSSKASIKNFIESLQEEVRVNKLNMRVTDVFSAAFKSEITKDRVDFNKLIDPDEIAELIYEQILSDKSFFQDKIHIRRTKF